MEIAIVCDSRPSILYQGGFADICKYGNDLEMWKVYDVRVLAEYTGEVLWLIDNGYYMKRDGMYMKRGGMKYILSMKALVKKEKNRLMKEWNDDFFLASRYRIELYKDVDIEDIICYDFELEIEIDGMRMKIVSSQVYINVVYVRVPYENKELKEKMTKLLGNPRSIPELKQQKYGWLPLYYIVPVSKIDKIIGIKKYRDIGYRNLPPYAKKEEEIILDLNDFNPNVFMIFSKHGMLSTYYDIEKGAKWIYKNEKMKNRISSIIRKVFILSKNKNGKDNDQFTPRIRISSIIRKSFILYQNEVRENSGGLQVYKEYDIRILPQYAGEVLWLMGNGYYIKRDGMKRALSMDLLVEEGKRRLMEDRNENIFLKSRYKIFLYKDIEIGDVQAYYDFELEIEIDGMRMKIQSSQIYVNAVYVRVSYENKELKEKMTRLLGAPKAVPEQEHGKEVGIASYHIVPVSKIDKIIGIKKYRKISELGDCGSPTYSKEEEIIFDLKGYDPDIFMSFKEHGMLRMYYDFEIKTEKIYKE